ncbi:hypothetical protein [Desemzia incerta]|uniref:hypothetical protein n=1 Tax=Desemzia incerta TaxID=82801 RepID=UPI0033160C35
MAHKKSGKKKKATQQNNLQSLQNQETKNPLRSGFLFGLGKILANTLHDTISNFFD